MNLSLATLLISFLVLTEAASIKQQLQRAESVQNGRGENETRGGALLGGDARLGRRGAIGLGRRAPEADGRARTDAHAATDSFRLGNETVAGAMAASPSSGYASSETSLQSKKPKASSPASATAKGNTNKASKTMASSATAATASQTAKIVNGKINMTLASMPYEQVMCKNATEVQSGSVINATWLSKGKYTNTVYVRYGIDDYAAWNLPPGGTLPPFTGIAVKADPLGIEVDEPNGIYRMTFQTQVFAYQKGLKLSILLQDNQKGIPVVTYESPEIMVQARCELKEKDPLSGKAAEKEKEEEETGFEKEEKVANAELEVEEDEQDPGESDLKMNKADLVKNKAKNAAAMANVSTPMSSNGASSSINSSDSTSSSSSSSSISSIGAARRRKHVGAAATFQSLILVFLPMSCLLLCPPI